MGVAFERGKGGRGWGMGSTSGALVVYQWLPSSAQPCTQHELELVGGIVPIVLVIVQRVDQEALPAALRSTRTTIFGILISI